VFTIVYFVNVYTTAYCVHARIPITESVDGSIVRCETISPWFQLFSLHHQHSVLDAGCCDSRHT